MTRASTYRPQLLSLEERAAPGTVLSSFDPSWPLSLDTGPADRDFVRFNRDGSEGVVLGGAGQAEWLSFPSLPQPGELGNALSTGLRATDRTDPGVVNWQRLLGNGQVGEQGGDVVDIAVVTGSSITVGSLGTQTFGDDAGTARLTNVFISNDGSGVGVVTVAQGDIGLPSANFSIGGVQGTATLIPMSDAVGTYDRNTGSASVTFTFNIEVSSTAPGFHTCRLPNAISVAISTDTAPNGSAFFTGDDGNGHGTLEDNTAAIPALAHGSCGSFIGLDYADVINGYIGLPSPSGNNDLTINARMEPSIGP